MAERLRRVPRRVPARGSAERTCATSTPSCAPACAAEARPLPRRARALDEARRRPARAFAGPAAEGRVELIGLGGDPRGAAAARDRAGRRAADRRRPALAPAPLRLGARLLAARVRLRAGARAAAAERGRRVLLRRPERRTRQRSTALAPGRDRGRAGRVPDRLAGDRAGLVAGRLSLRPRPTPSSTASRCAAMRLWCDRRRPLRPRRPRRRGRASRRASSLAAVAERLRGFARGARAARPARLRDRHRAARPLVVGGPAWLAAVLDGAAGGRGPAACTVARGARPSTRPSERPLRALELGRGQGPATWDSPPVADLAWGARRLELRLLRGARASGLARRRAPSAPRASCSRSRRATGRSSTTAARRATTPSSGRRPRARRCSRP